MPPHIPRGNKFCFHLIVDAGIKNDKITALAIMYVISEPSTVWPAYCLLPFYHTPGTIVKLDRFIVFAEYTLQTLQLCTGMINSFCKRRCGSLTGSALDSFLLPPALRNKNFSHWRLWDSVLFYNPQSKNFSRLFNDFGYFLTSCWNIDKFVKKIIKKCLH